MVNSPVGLLLALDTSSATIGYALHDGSTLLAEAAWLGQRQGTATLLGAVWQSLAAVGKTKADLTGIAVATGPGSFSGLRVGLGIAKGLALGLDVPIIGVPTLEITAAPFAAFASPGGVICALVAAGRERYAYALYMASGNTLHGARDVAHGTAPDIAQVLAAYPVSLICGEMDTAAEEAIAAVPGAIVLPVGVRGRRSGALADLGWQRILSGRVDDLVMLEPMYLHTISAVRNGKG